MCSAKGTLRGVHEVRRVQTDTCWLVPAAAIFARLAKDLRRGIVTPRHRYTQHLSYRRAERSANAYETNWFRQTRRKLEIFGNLSFS